MIVTVTSYNTKRSPISNQFETKGDKETIFKNAQQDARAWSALTGKPIIIYESVNSLTIDYYNEPDFIKRHYQA